MAVLNDYLSNHAELLQNYGSISMDTQRLCIIAYEGFKTLNNQNSKHYEKNILSFSKSNSQKRQSLC